MHVIGEDCSRRLDVIPAQYRVIVTRRPKYACRTCQEGVVQAPAPARLIEGGLPTERASSPAALARPRVLSFHPLQRGIRSLDALAHRPRESPKGLVLVAYGLLRYPSE